MSPAASFEQDRFVEEGVNPIPSVRHACCLPVLHLGPLWEYFPSTMHSGFLEIAFRLLCLMWCNLVDCRGWLP